MYIYWVKSQEIIKIVGLITISYISRNTKGKVPIHTCAQSHLLPGAKEEESIKQTIAECKKSTLPKWIHFQDHQHSCKKMIIITMEMARIV